MRRLLLAVVLGGSSCASFAAPWDAEFEFDCGANPRCQGDFREIVEDLTAAVNYKALGPAEATGLTGIAVGGIVSYVSTESDAWERLTGEDIEAVGMAGLIVRKGLPLNLDVGAFYSTVPGTDVDLYGGELRWAILEGGVASPALAVRGSFTRASGMDDLDYDAYGVDVSVSKGFTLFTPYAGIGRVWAEADPDASTTLRDEEIEEMKYFVGMRLGLGLLDITPEYERLGDRNAYNLLVGLSF